MLFTRSDPRAGWRAACAEGGDALARAASLPSGAREAPLEWIAEVRVERRGHFDRDRDEEVHTEHPFLARWRDDFDARIAHAGAISFLAIDAAALGTLWDFPGPDRLGPGISTLALGAHLLQPQMLERIGRAREWTDLQLFAARWSAPARAAGVRELASGFRALRGLELRSAYLAPPELGVIASAPWVEALEDLAVAHSPLDAGAAGALLDRARSLVHLDLFDARLGRRALARASLARSRRIVLSGCDVGDALLERWIEGGALARVEDLWLEGCGLGDRSAHALAAGELPALRGLWIARNEIGDDGIAALVRSPLFARLEGASLAQRGAGERARALLAGHPLEGALTGTARLPGVHALWVPGR